MVELAVSPPLSAKTLRGADGLELLLVGSAASLLEGDVLAVELAVGPGSRLTVRSAAAQLAHPCPHGGRTRLDVRADVGADAVLVWAPEPLVVCAGADHVSSAHVALHDSAVAVWCDEVVLGRSGEAPSMARVATSLRVEQAGRPLLHDGLDTSAPGAHGPAVLGGRRYVAAVHLLGRRGPVGVEARLARFEQAGPATSWRTLAAETAGRREEVTALVAGLERATGRGEQREAARPAPGQEGGAATSSAR